MSTISEKLAEWVQTTGYSDISQDIVKVAKRCILDFIGVTLAGTTEPTAKIVKQYVAKTQGKEEATVIGLGTKTSCLEAAFANGTIGHCLDFEDYILPAQGAGGPHITAVVFPAALALAEKTNTTGKDLLEAYVMGTEVAFHLGLAVEPVHFNLGWHNTETEGVFGATIAACKLLNLNNEQIVCALGITGSEASGLRENFGTMTKPFHAGQSNAKGIRSAMLAQLGFTSAKTIFEGKSGFFHTMCKEVRPDALTQNLGKPFRLSQVKIKLYPCCGGSHRAIEATLSLVKQHNLKPEDIEELTVKAPTLISTVMLYDKPTTALEGKFSMQFPLALAINEKKVTLQQFTDEKVRETGTVALMQKIKLIFDKELDNVPFPAAPQIVQVVTKDGRNLVKRVDFNKGTPQNPLSDDDLLEKYRSCAGMVLPKKKVEKSINLIMNLEKIDDLSELLSLIRGT